jgi:hypothetical protein
MSITSIPDAILAARAAQHAEVVRKQRARGLRLRRRRAHERRVHVMAATAAGALLAAVLASGFYLGVIPVPSRAVAINKPGNNTFAETRTGQLLIPADGGWCKTLSFNNANGEFTNSKLVNCDDYNGSTPGPAGRMGGYTSFTDSFRKR